MHTTSGLLAYLGHRLGAVGLLMVVLLAVAMAVAAGFAILALGQVLAASADPVQVAPVRWIPRY